jgi:hypothetical protein
MIVPYTDKNSFLNSYIQNAILYVPESSVDDYRATVPWREFKELVGINATGIDELEIAPAEVQLFDVYDLSGRKVAHQVTSLEGLPNGIYIVNGKKMLKK